MDRMSDLDMNAKMPSFETGLSRRDVLGAAAVGAAVVASLSIAAEAAPASSFGAPLVELHVPAHILTVEQRGAMIKDITEVIVEALGRPLDPAKRLFVEIFEATEGGYGVNGQAFLPKPK
jgi:phenylpyruvate tautomerase PptA (4-oxalocrotonate tautomerase family)